MPSDPYASCPCGSGKKFKWCCQPIHAQINRAFQQDADGQHETALRLMDEVVVEHPGNPEVWGRKAQLLYQNSRVEDAETALQKAFEVNPNYAFGYLLRGNFRYHEGEIPGALLLFRKAAELYDPEARDLLAQVYSLIADCELKLNRPVAARAAVRIALHCQPGQPGLRDMFEQVFGDKSRLPACARREYTFLSPAQTSEGSRRAAWDKALAGAATTRLSDVCRMFEELTAEDPNDASAWYNLGVSRAWLGDNPRALEALDRYVSLETDEARGGAAWTLGEVLRCGHGLEEQADYVEYAQVSQIRDPQPLVGLLDEWQQARRLIGVQMDEQQGIFTGLIVETQPTLTVGTGIASTARFQAYLLVAAGFVRLWSPVKENLERANADLRMRIGPALTEPQAKVDRIVFTDVVAEALIFPMGQMDQAEFERRIQDQAARHFEETWLHRPLRSLNLIPPVDAAGHGVLRKKLIGAVQFLQDCAAVSMLSGYDFNRLRRKLGLLETAVATTGAAPADFRSMGPAELAAFPVEQLSDEQLEQAFQAALTLDMQDLAGHFARAVLSRPPRVDRPDRYPWYSHLVQRALAEGNTDAALDLVNEGEKTDCEQNEGRRRNDYELRRGQVHTRRGEADQACDVFQRLIERVPTELRYRGNAAEAMLSLKQGTRALQFAEEGLKNARAQNNRDSEQHFLELVAAAKKQVG